MQEEISCLMFIVSLKKQKEFLIVTKWGSRINSVFFSAMLLIDFCVRSENSSKLFFFGVNVSKRLFRQSVLRNKVKRRARHLVRNLLMCGNGDKIFSKSCFALLILPAVGFDCVNFTNLSEVFCNVFFSACSKGLRERTF